MDRVYGTNSTQQAFLNYAQEHGWKRRQYQTYDDEYYVYDPEEGPITLEMIVELQETDFSRYPYCDTMKYLGPGKVSNERFPGFTKYLTDTDGGGEMYSCHHCDSDVHMDDVFFDQNDFPYCHECYDELFISCHVCGINVDAYSSHTTSDESDSYCQSCWERLVASCHYCHDFVPIEDMIPIESYYVCSGCDHHIFTCDNCDDDYNKEEMNEYAKDGNIYAYCNDCLNNVEEHSHA